MTTPEDKRTLREALEEARLAAEETQRRVIERHRRITNPGMRAVDAPLIEQGGARSAK